MKVFIPIMPVPKARPRFSRNGHVYTPKQTTDFESVLRWKFKELMHDNSNFFSKALSITIKFFLKPPQSTKRKLPSVRPDIDNYAKAVLDSMNGIVFKDDCQVVQLVLSKHYDESFGIDVTVEAVEI